MREILKHPNVEHVTLVDLDPAMTGLFSRSEPLVKLNQGALRIRASPSSTTTPAAGWKAMPRSTTSWSTSRPSNFGLGRLYSVPVYHLMARHLAENGYMVIQSTSPYFAPRSFWSVDATLKAGLHTWPYHAYVPSFGDWGFILAGKRRDYTPPEKVTVPARYLDPATLRELFRFPPTCPRWPCRRTA